MPSRSRPAEGPPKGHIVSSAHLAAGASPGLSEVEYGLILAGHAFQRWMVRCMAAAGLPGLSPTEILILHTVQHRGRPKRQAEILLALGIEDAHIATYAIRKLAGAGLVMISRAGKEKLVAITPEGAALCARYAGLRERLLAQPVSQAGPAAEALSEVAALLRTLSGFYDAASRGAATL
ncbi:winged helix DNA-binding protein [Paracraurococcus lichenis]|uniref:Winged helix DNA-binding protein n=1 Tax=Paracraurococcus lichenis TaxID=3064888 RepID=A0ABT9E517_9PROT|nr:winged helix DNA-binding protein [Paracraurococcus sp. LOR1-02]MDO9711239.1 winged helix DNA-binding protein [Paracraurococcus sp. LOR1-02]